MFLPILAWMMLAPASLGQAAQQTSSPDAIPVSTTAIPLNASNPAQQRIGKLRYMGGLHLTSSNRRLGGLSGLRWNDKYLYAVSDEGDFFELELREREDRLIGLGEVLMGRLKGVDGKPLDEAAADAEALEILRDGTACELFNGCGPAGALIALEKSNRLLDYLFGGGLPTFSAEERSDAEGWRRGLPPGGGIEAMAASTDALMLLSAGQSDGKGRASGVLVYDRLDPSGASADGMIAGYVVKEERRFGLPLSDGFRPSDADFARGKNGVEALVLQRRRGSGSGPAARLVRFSVSAGDIAKPDVRIGEPEILATLAAPLNIDSMEGLAVRQDGKRTFVYMISDDDFADARRTVLLKFELLD
jgi:hypothetical protein